MAAIKDALNGLKATLEDVNPTPQPAPVQVYVWPDDYAIMSYENLPFIIVAQVVNRPFLFADRTYGGTLLHSWQAEILIHLAKAATRLEAGANAEAMHEPWIFSLASVLSADRSLGGNCHSIGNGEQLMSYRVGNLGWDRAKIFWGIRAEIWVHQHHSVTVS